MADEQSYREHPTVDAGPGRPRRLARPSLCALAGLLALGPVLLRPKVAHAIEPATIVVAVKAAKEVAGVARDFFEFINYMPTQKDPLAGVPEKLDEIQTAVHRIEIATAETLEIVQRIEDAEVREANEDALDGYLDALEHVTAARIALRYLADDPDDHDFRLSADTETRLAVVDFETRPQFFRLTGPTVIDQRFSHVLMYAGYLQALALRTAFIQLTEGQRGFTHEPYRSETYASVHQLGELIREMNEALVIETQVFGPHPSEFVCTYGSITLSDFILYDHGPVHDPDGSPARHVVSSGNLGSNQTVRVVDFPGESCDANAISFYLDEPVQALRAERTDEYGAPEISAVAATLQDYADYGQSPPPTYQFPQWIAGSLFTTPGTLSINPYRTIIPVEAAPGALVQLASTSKQQHWKIPLGTGPITHMDSDLCLTAGIDASAIRLEICSGTPDQLWNVARGGSITQQASGLCLSSSETSILQGLASPLLRTVVFPYLHLAACNGSRSDQQWLTSDPTIPSPVVH